MWAIILTSASLSGIPLASSNSKDRTPSSHSVNKSIILFTNIMPGSANTFALSIVPLVPFIITSCARNPKLYVHRGPLTVMEQTAEQNLSIFSTELYQGLFEMLNDKSNLIMSMSQPLVLNE